MTDPHGVKHIDPLFVDVYAGDLGGHPNWTLLLSLGPPWHGGIVKASEGLAYNPPWFDMQWQTLRGAAGARYGHDWFRGAYHFLKLLDDGARQAELYLSTVERAGGWDVGDLWPIVDVELGGERNSNHHATADQVVECTTRFAETCRRETGRDVMLYGNGAMRDLGIRDRMGCDWLWLPRYTDKLPEITYQRAGWQLEQLVMWQYSGDGQAYLAGYPAFPPGFGKCDVSALVHVGGIEWLRSHLFAEQPDPNAAA